MPKDVAHHGPFDGPFSFFPGMAMTIAGEAERLRHGMIECLRLGMEKIYTLW
jgi:hypothetical protein